jgi:copper chaperone CopZ
MTTKIEVLEIEGMSCGHCVKSVQSALAAVPGVTSAKVTVGHAEVESSAPREALVRAIEAADFTVKGAQA